MAVKDKRQEQRGKRERQRADVSRRLEEHGSDWNKAWKLPPGMKQLKIESEDIFKLNFLEYVLSDGANERFAKCYADDGFAYFERTFYTHRLGPNNESHTCPALTFGKPCPVCEFKGRLAKQDYEKHKETISNLRASERQLFAVEDVDEAPGEVQILEYSNYYFGQYLDEKVKKKARQNIKYRNWSDPDDGFTLVLSPTKDKKSKYKGFIISDIEFEPRDPIPDDLLDQVPCLDDLILETPYDKMKRLMDFGDDDDGVDEPHQDDPPRKGREPRNSRAERNGDTDAESGPEKPARRGKPEPEKPKDMTAEEAGIEVGDDVTYRRGTWQVKKISGDGTSLTLKNEDGDTETGVGPDEVELLDKPDPSDLEPQEDEKPRGRSRSEPEPEKPARRSREEPETRTRGKSRSEPEPEAGDDDWEDWDDDNKDPEPEPEKPTRTRGKPEPEERKPAGRRR